MSAWTHVAAIVRVDGCSSDHGAKKLKAYFGKELFYGSGEAAWNDAKQNPDKYLPFGSEGSLTISVWKNPHENHLNGYTVSLFGDLRNYTRTQEILRWFKEKVSGVQMIRQAVITIMGGWDEPIVWDYWTDGYEEAKNSECDE